MSAFLASVSLKPCCHWKCHRRVQECALSGDSTLVFSQAITATSTLSFSTLGFPAGTSLQLLSWNATWLLFLLLRSKQQLNNPLRLHLCALYVHQAATEIHRSASLFQVLRLKLICGSSLRSSPKVSVSQWLGICLRRVDWIFGKGWILWHLHHNTPFLKDMSFSAHAQFND